MKLKQNTPGMAVPPILDPPPAPVGTSASVAVPLTYAPALRRRRVWRYFRPGTPLFFLIVLALVAGGIWGGWKWRLREDRKEFEACTTEWPEVREFIFNHRPTRGALRHLARMPGTWNIVTNWAAADERDAAVAFGSVRLANVHGIFQGPSVGPDPLLKELARPDSGLMSLSFLHLDRSRQMDVGVKELARPDSGLKTLTILSLTESDLTDEGLKALCSPDCGLKALTALELRGTKVTDAGIKEVAGPACGLKALAKLDLRGTKVTHAGIAALRAARPGLMVFD